MSLSIAEPGDPRRTIALGLQVERPREPALASGGVDDECAAPGSLFRLDASNAIALHDWMQLSAGPNDQCAGPARAVQQDRIEVWPPQSAPLPAASLLLAERHETARLPSPGDPMAFVAEKTRLPDGVHHAETLEKRLDSRMRRLARTNPWSDVALEHNDAQRIGTRGDCGGGTGRAATNNHKVGFRNRLHSPLCASPPALVLAPEEHGVRDLTVEFLCDAHAATPDILRQLFAPRSRNKDIVEPRPNERGVGARGLRRPIGDRFRGDEPEVGVAHAIVRRWESRDAVTQGLHAPDQLGRVNPRNQTDIEGIAQTIAHVIRAIEAR